MIKFFFKKQNNQYIIEHTGDNKYVALFNCLKGYAEIEAHYNLKTKGLWKRKS